ncbi:MAG: hypothetical protein IKU24_00235 [Clostridia bacterium]|nr:hypothetical protein [Clostridia bacterium]
MAEIIISFFAVIGITFLAIYFCDYIFFRKFYHKLTLLIDLREKSELETIEIFELILSVRDRKSGKCATGEIFVLTKESQHDVIRIANHYIKSFQLPGKILDESEFPL